jgi:mRNA interferase HigB
MNVITKKAFVDASKKYPNERNSLLAMFKILKKNDFSTPNDLKAVFPSLDNFKYKDKWWVLDVGGNNLRLILFIQFVNKRIFVKHIVSHADYDKLSERYRKEKQR